MNELIDNNKETLAELLAERELLDRKINELKDKQKKEHINYIVALVKEFNLEPSEIFNNMTKAKTKVITPLQKYKDPSTGKTWSGRGRAPGWMIGNFEKFKID